MDPQLAAYLTVTALLVLTPGSTTAVVVRNTISGGRAAGIAAAAGAAFGNISHASAAGLGLAVFFSRTSWTATVLSVSGGAFLAWLGLRSVYNAFRLPHREPVALQPAHMGPRKQGGSFRQGVAVNLLNPAIATFYLVVVPSFLAPGSPRWHFAALAAVHVGMALLCQVIWAVALDHVRRILQRSAARRILEGAAGIALITLSLRVLLR